MKKYAFRRLLQLIPILFAITFLSYGMMRIAGSDVVTQKMENTGQIVSEDRLNAAREQLSVTSKKALRAATLRAFVSLHGNFTSFLSYY